MAIISIFLESVATLLHSLIFMYIILVVVGSVLSWVNPDPYNPIVQMIRRLTEPVYSYIRKYIPTNFNGIDFAPVVLLIGLQFIDLFLVRVLMHLAESLK